MQGVLKYVSQDHKTKWGDLKFVAGHNCVHQCAFTEIMTTKKRFYKTNGRRFKSCAAKGIEQKGLHSLRYTFGSFLVNGIRQPEGKVRNVWHQMRKIQAMENGSTASIPPQKQKSSRNRMIPGTWSVSAKRVAL